MDKSKDKHAKSDQFFYIDRWVDKKCFRAFVYDENGNQKLANSYQEFENLISSGIWFAVKPNASSKNRKHKNAANSNSK